MSQRWQEQRVPVRRGLNTPTRKIDSHTRQQDLLAEMGALLTRLSHLRGEWPAAVWDHCNAWAAIIGQEIPDER